MSSVSAFRSALSRFRKEEDGALIIFALMLFCLMIMIGGMAVDFMRYEWRRTALQNTLDRGVLAAAAMNQQLDREAVVRDYFDKSAIKGDLEDIEVVSTLNGSEVTATGAVDLNPFFLHWVGIEEMTAHGVAAAEQRVNNVEVVLVLDVSGSMSGQKITDLREAAAEFVQTVLESDAEGRISIAVVPYNAQVNLGPTLRAEYNATYQHGVSGVNCVELPSSVFSSPGLSTTTALPMAAYADVSNGTNTANSYTAWSDTTYARMNTSAPFCRNAAQNIVRLPSRDVATLQSQINALTAGGNTSITLGMKWGLTLLDPGSRPVFDDLISQNAMPSDFAGRPFDYDDTDAMKVIVLMTDGEHVSHTRINDAYKTGTSPIYRSAGDGNYSIRFTSGRPASAGSNQYWVPHRNEWRSGPWNSGAGVTQQTWQQVWANQRLSWVAWQLYARALGTSSSTRTTQYNTAISTLSSTYASVDSMNTSLQESCSLARDRGVLVYGIAFEAPSNGQTQIRNCSTDDGYYFDASTDGGLDIQSVFRTIATSITQLRLTQ